MFYIVDNGGDVVFPPDGSPDRSRAQSLYNQNISGLFRKGFYFYYDPGRDYMVSHFKGKAGRGDQLTSNQFYGIYEPDETEDDIFTTFEDKVESAFDSQGWQTSKTGQSADSIFTDLSSSSPGPLRVNDELLRRLLDKSLDRPLQLGAPDFSAALRVCKRLTKDFGDVRVAICTSGVIEELPESDVVVVPKDTDETGVPTRDSEEVFEQEELLRRIEKTKSIVTSFVERGAADDQPPERALVEVLESGFTSTAVESIKELGIRIDTEERKAARESRVASISEFSGGIVGVLLVLGLSLHYGLLEHAIGVLNLWVYLDLSFVPGLGSTLQTIPVKSWYVVGLCLPVVLLLLSTCLKTDKQGIPLLWKKLVPTEGPRSIRAALTSSISVPSNKDIVTRKHEQILDSLYAIKNHSAIEDVGGFGNASEEVFSGVKALKVYDRSRYRWDYLVTVVSRFNVGVLSGASAIALFFGVGVFASTFWNYFLGGLIAVPIVLVGKRSLPYLARIGSVLQDWYQEAPIPSRRESIQGAVLLAGAWSTTQLGGFVWRRNEGLSYQLLIGFAGEVPGRFVSVDAGVEMLFFGTVGFVLVALLISARTAEEPFLPAALCLATVGGLAHLWYDASVILVSKQAWLVGFVVGIAVAVVVLGVLSMGVDYLTPEQITSWISLMFGAILVVGFVESQLQYTSPLRYDVTGREFVLAASSFSGYAYGLAFRPVVFSLLHFGITLGAMYVLSTAISRDGDPVEVLVVGPIGSDPYYHVSLLFKHLHIERGTKPNANEKVEAILNQLDEIDIDESSRQLLEYNGVEPVKFTTSTDQSFRLMVWTPLSKYSIIDDDVLDVLRRVDEEDRRYLPEEGSGVTGFVLRNELAMSLTSADVLVLLFPMNVQIGYFEDYLDLLENHLGDEQRAIGIINSTRDFVSQYEEDIDENWEEFSRRATDEVFKGRKDEMREKLSSHLDNGEDSILLPVLEGPDEGTRGAKQELEYILRLV